MIRLVTQLPEKQLEWRNDEAVYLTCRQNELIQSWEQEYWEKSLRGDNSRKFFGVEVVPTSKIPGFRGRPVLVGTAGLSSIRYDHGTAEYSLLIGPEFQRRGYGKQALVELLRYGFESLRLHCIWGEIMAHNPTGVRLAEAVGFTKEGLLRHRYWKRGAFVDSVMYSMLDHDYFFKYAQRKIEAVE